MNTHSATTKQLDGVMTFYVILMFVVSTLVFATYITLHDVIPFAQHFVDTLTVTPQQN